MEFVIDDDGEQQNDMEYVIEDDGVQQNRQSNQGWTGDSPLEEIYGIESTAVRLSTWQQGKCHSRLTRHLHCCRDR